MIRCFLFVCLFVYCSACVQLFVFVIYLSIGYLLILFYLLFHLLIYLLIFRNDFVSLKRAYSSSVILNKMWL